MLFKIAQGVRLPIKVGIVTLNPIGLFAQVFIDVDRVVTPLTQLRMERANGKAIMID